MQTEETPAWVRRYRAPTVGFPAWSRHAPDRLVFTATGTGSHQLETLDLATGARGRATDDPVGVEDGTPTANGSGIVWLQDETGDESGHFVVRPFGGGETRPLLDGAPRGWSGGVALGLRVVAAGISNDDGFAVYASSGGGPAKRIVRSDANVVIGGHERGGFNLGGLSADESLLCLEHAERGDLVRPALYIVDPRSGEIVAEQWDGEGLGLRAAAWSPIAGDQRLAIVHDREGEERPAIWDVESEVRMDIPLDLSGLVAVYDWWPDGSALLLVNLHEGRDRLYRYELEGGRLTPIDHPEGTISGARVRPDGEVWLRVASGAEEPRVLTETGDEVITPTGDRAPAGRAYRSWSFANPHGQRVHGFLVTPPGDGPFPVFMWIHGGPTWLCMDDWSPDVQALVDHGFAVAMPNYRGSVGYGVRWRDFLVGNIGFPEVEDAVSGLDDLVAQGVADPSRAVIGGWSWGGYITLLAVGTRPERWTAGVAGVPVGDYAACYGDLSPPLQAYDRYLLGGTLEEKAELVRERSPITYVDQVRAPVLALIGDNDTRCPPRQAMLYVDALRERGGDVDVYRYGTGHVSFVIEEEVRQMRAVLDFLDRQVPL